MKKAAVPSFLAAAGLVQTGAALQSHSPDDNIVVRDDGWEGVTPDMIEVSIDAMNTAW